MRRTIQVVLSGLCLAVLTTPAAALVMHSESEAFGPAPKLEKKPSDQRFVLAHLPGRVYWLHSTWSGFGHNRDEGVVASQGDAEAANHALAEFALLPTATVKEIHLLPGPGTSRSVKGKVTQPCAWEIRWSSYEPWPKEKNYGSEQHQASITLYIDRAAVVGAPDARVQQWINELDSERFEVRQHAFKALDQQGDAALPLLQKALETKGISLEVKRHLEQLVRRLKPIHAARLQFPKGIPVVGVDELLRLEAKNWRSGDLGKSWGASQKISTLAEYTEESFPLLIEMLQDDREMVRDNAVGAFGHLGARATTAVAALKAAAKKSKPEVRPALAKALEAVTAAPLSEDGWARNREQRAEIARFLRGVKKP